jgi:hypothetical protein
MGFGLGSVDAASAGGAVAGDEGDVSRIDGWPETPIETN